MPQALHHTDDKRQHILASAVEVDPTQSESGKSDVHLSDSAERTSISFESAMSLVPPPTLREILEAYQLRGSSEEDRGLLLEVLRAKGEEDQSIARLSTAAAMQLQQLNSTLSSHAHPRGAESHTPEEANVRPNAPSETDSAASLLLSFSQSSPQSTTTPRHARVISDSLSSTSSTPPLTSTPREATFSPEPFPPPDIASPSSAELASGLSSSSSSSGLAPERRRRPKRSTRPRLQKPPPPASSSSSTTSRPVPANRAFVSNAAPEYSGSPVTAPVRPVVPSRPSLRVVEGDGASGGLYAARRQNATTVPPRQNHARTPTPPPILEEQA